MAPRPPIITRETEDNDPLTVKSWGKDVTVDHDDLRDYNAEEPLSPSGVVSYSEYLNDDMVGTEQAKKFVEADDLTVC